MGMPDCLSFGSFVFCFWGLVPVDDMEGDVLLIHFSFTSFFFFFVTVLFVEKDNGGVSCVYGCGMDGAFRDVESVAFGIPDRCPVQVKIYASFEDDLPLVVVGMRWYFNVVFKMHEDDLLLCALYKVCGESGDLYIYLWEFFYGFWEQIIHLGSSPRMISPWRYVFALPEM
jgi:hypothetical protein